MKKKRGLSTIVSTLLILLLVFVAIGIVWVVVRNVIQEGSEQISLGKYTLSLDIERVEILEGNNFSIGIKRNAGPGEFVGVHVIASDGKNSETFVVEESLQEHQRKFYTFNIKDFDISDLEKIDIAPVFRLESGREVVGDVGDTWVKGSRSSSGFVSSTCLEDSECDDGKYSTNDSCSSGSCVYTEITECIDDDNYCTPGCSTNEDNNCVQCTVSNSDTVCDDNDVGTEDSCVSGICQNEDITECIDGDNYCTPGCYSGNDDYCSNDCVESSNCDSGQVCDGGSCVAEGSDNGDGSLSVSISASSYEQNPDYGTHPPEFSFDNNLSEESRWSAKGDGEWILFSFNDTITFDEVQIIFWQQESREYDFDLEVSDGQSWTNVISTSSPIESAGTFSSFGFSEQTGSDVRITGHGNTDSDWINIIEIRFLNNGDVVDVNFDSSECVSGQKTDCSDLISNGNGERSCVDGSRGSCEVTSCDTGYVPEGNSCVAESSDNGDTEVTLDEYCSPQSYVHLDIVDVPIKSASDYGAVVYIDPDYSGSSDGSIGNPYTSWPEVLPLQGDTAYLQKRGTVSEISGEISLSQDNILVGAYGSGSRPVVSAVPDLSGYQMFVFDSNNNVLRDVRIESQGGTVHGISSEYFSDYDAQGIASHNVIYNNSFYNTAIVSWSRYLRVLKNDVSYAGSDSVFIQNAQHVEFGYNNVSFSNQKWHEWSGSGTCPESDCPGDSLQFSVVNNWYVHNNILDRSDTGNKFGFIANIDDASGSMSPDHEGLFECNVIKGPLATGDGGASVYIGGSQDNRITLRYNNIIEPFPVPLWSNSKIEFHSNTIFGGSPDSIHCNDCDIYDNTYI